jgi:hypothetical protein
VVAYSFKPQFEAALRSGDKAQTIRALGKRRHARPGEMLQIYLGMRTANCRLLFQSECVEVVPIILDKCEPNKPYLFTPARKVILNGQALSINEIHQLALADGFPDRHAFYQFFEDRLPFEGVLIRWKTPPF